MQCISECVHIICSLFVHLVQVLDCFFGKKLLLEISMYNLLEPSSLAMKHRGSFISQNFYRLSVSEISRLICQSSRQAILALVPLRAFAFADGLASSWQSGSSRQSASSPVRRKEVADSQINALAQSAGAIILRTSSATGEGVSELFQGVAEDLAPGITKACFEEDQFMEELQLRTPVLGPEVQEADAPDGGSTHAGLSKSKAKLSSCCS